MGYEDASSGYIINKALFNPHRRLLEVSNIVCLGDHLETLFPERRGLVLKEVEQGQGNAMMSYFLSEMG